MRSIFVLCEYATLNGGEQSMLSTLSGVIRAGYRVSVAAPPVGPLAEALRNAGVESVPFEPRNSSGIRLPLDLLRRQLAEVLRSRRPDLVHANSLAMGRLSGPVVKDLALPSLSHLRDIASLSRQAIADLNCHARLLAVSQATRQFHVAQGLAAEKTFLLYNGIDLERFRFRPRTGYLHRELGLPEELPLIGAIGQISLRKGHDVAAAALSQVSGAGVSPAPANRDACATTPFAWLIVGQRFSGKAESRQFEDQLRRSAAGPLAGKVYFLGVRDDIPQILNELTLLVHPAQQEPLGRVLLEAAASGVAIIATDVGGTREIFPPQCEAACLVPPDDVQAMSAAIDRLLRNGASPATGLQRPETHRSDV